MSASHTSLLRSLFDAAVAGAEPRRATERAVARLTLGRGRLWVIALGKAAPAMAAGAVDALAAARREPAGGLIVAAGDAEAPHPALATAVGDHPVPGERSRAAAALLGDVARRVRGGDSALVLLSGGTSSLVGAPVEGVDPRDLARLHQLVLASGADIEAMNAVRKRFARWGAGRLAAALAPARVHCLAVSDVIGDDLATIGSGPCVPDRYSVRDLRERLVALGLDDASLPATVRDHLEAVRRGRRPETPKPGDAAFGRVSCEVLLGNAHAVDAVARRARQLGWRIVGVRHELRGEAARRGTELAQFLRAMRLRLESARGSDDGRACFVWGGETTVTLTGAPADALGGRCQELALAAARALYVLGEPPGAVALLAAGTDGRDGPTDAAGAIVDPSTWGAVRAAGRDPGRDLSVHDAYRALDAAGALVRTGLTGTNVMDVVIGVVRTDRQ